MDSDPLAAALAALTDDDLAALAEGTYTEDAPSPGLMAWLEHLADWEQHRRIAVELPLMPPEAAIDESEADDALAIAIVLRDSFAEEPDYTRYCPRSWMRWPEPRRGNSPHVAQQFAATARLPPSPDLACLGHTPFG